MRLRPANEPNALLDAELGDELRPSELPGFPTHQHDHAAVEVRRRVEQLLEPAVGREAALVENDRVEAVLETRLILRRFTGAARDGTLAAGGQLSRTVGAETRRCRRVSSSAIDWQTVTTASARLINRCSMTAQIRFSRLDRVLSRDRARARRTRVGSPAAWPRWPRPEAYSDRGRERGRSARTAAADRPGDSTP